MTRIVLCRIVVLTLILPTQSRGQPTCAATPLEDRQIKGIVDGARSADDSLPAAFNESTWKVNRQGCHYVYIEHPVPPRADQWNLFTVNQRGIIVDIKPGHMACPGRAFTDTELAGIVQRERRVRKDRPAPLANFTARVARWGCLYLYYENPVPVQPANFQVFIIDPLGEVLEVSVKP